MSEGGLWPIFGVIHVAMLDGGCRLACVCDAYRLVADECPGGAWACSHGWSDAALSVA